MKKRDSLKFIFVLLLFLFNPLSSILNPQSLFAKQKVQWQGWSADLFEKAKKEDKFVLLDLQAVWCHWCHVMEDTTYQDPKVIGLIGKKYIPVRVDQDANPDLSSALRGLGVAGHCGVCPRRSEIVKRRGFIEPQNMQSLLQAIINRSDSRSFHHQRTRDAVRCQRFFDG